MARIGIGYKEVEEAAIYLQGQGRMPTVDGIRDVLRTGSKTTIANHLKNWKGRQTEEASRLPSELQSIVNGLWERLHQEAQIKITQLENDYANQINALQQYLIEEKNQHAQTKNQLTQQKIAYDTQDNEKALLQSEHNALQLEQAKLKERYQNLETSLEQIKGENTKLHQLANNIQANLEHYQNAMQQQQLQHSLEQEKRQAQHHHELLTLRTQLQESKVHQQHLSDALIDSKTLLEQLEKENKEQKNLYSTVLNQNQQLGQENKELENRHQQQLYIIKMHKNTDSERKEFLIQIEKHNNFLMTSNHELKLNLQQMQDKIATLHNEFNILQEKKAEKLNVENALDN